MCGSEATFMTDWKELRHAYGDAGDIPRLLDQLSHDPKAEVLTELWHRLFHQGTVYSVSYAALEPLCKLAEGSPPAKRIELLALIGGIIASGDLTGVDQRPVDLIKAMTPTLQRLAEESLRLRGLDRTNFVYLLQAASAFDGDLFWSQHLEDLVHGEFEGQCPGCDHDLLLVIGEYGFFTTAEDWVTKGANPKREPIEPAEPTALFGRAAWLNEAAVKYHQTEIAVEIRHLFGTTKCPKCGASFDVASAIARFDLD
jgi:hypothetical protein